MDEEEIVEPTYKMGSLTQEQISLRDELIEEHGEAIIKTHFFRAKMKAVWEKANREKRVARKRELRAMKSIKPRREMKAKEFGLLVPREQSKDYVQKVTRGKLFPEGKSVMTERRRSKKKDVAILEEEPEPALLEEEEEIG